MGSDDLAGVIMGIWNDRLIDKEWNMVLENNFLPEYAGYRRAFMAGRRN